MTTSRSPAAAERMIVPDAATTTRTETVGCSESSSASAPDCSTVVVVPRRRGGACVPGVQAAWTTQARASAMVRRVMSRFLPNDIPERRNRSTPSAMWQARNARAKLSSGRLSIERVIVFALPVHSLRAMFVAGGGSSVGRAPGLQESGQRSDPRALHVFSIPALRLDPELFRVLAKGQDAGS